MANWLDVDDMVLYYDTKLLCKLTNDTESVTPSKANIDTAVLNELISYQQECLSNYFRGIYTLPDTPDADLKGILADMVICRLWQRRGGESQQVSEMRTRTDEMLHRFVQMRTDMLRDDDDRTTAKMPINRS